jgi:uncharacterized protein YukE
MSIELPDELVWALSFIGLPWPTVDEDQIHEYASHLRSYASSLEQTHANSHGTIAGLSQGYSGRSYEALFDRWAHATSRHMRELIEACRTFATALDVVADGVVTAKVGILAALAAMVVEFVAEQAAAVETLGLAEFANFAIVGSTRFIVKRLLDQLEQVVIAEVLQAALSPLEATIDQAVQALVLRGMEAAVG